jgi:hypothetical protein
MQDSTVQLSEHDKEEVKALLNRLKTLNEIDDSDDVDEDLLGIAGRIVARSNTGKRLRESIDEKTREIDVLDHERQLIVAQISNKVAEREALRMQLSKIEENVRLRLIEETEGN